MNTDDRWQHNDSTMRLALIAQLRDDEKKRTPAPQSPCANSSPRLDVDDRWTERCANCGFPHGDHVYIGDRCPDPHSSTWLPKPDVSQLPAPDRGPDSDEPLTVDVDPQGGVGCHDNIIHLVPGHCARLAARAILKNLRTGEKIFVRQAHPTDTIIVTRAYAGSPAGECHNGEELAILYDGKALIRKPTYFHTEVPDPFDALERACWNFLTAADTPELSAARKEKIRSMFDRAYHKFHRYPAEPQRLAHRTGVPPTASESGWRKTIEVGDTVRTCDAWTQGRVTKVEHSAERVFWISTAADGKEVYNMALMHEVFLVAKHDEGERFPAAKRKPVAVGGNDALADAAFGKVPKTPPP